MELRKAILLRVILPLGGILLSGFISSGAVGSEVVGEVFGKPVTDEEFSYYYKTASLFSRSGNEQRSEDETRKEAWQDMILLREAEQSGVAVEKVELQEELKRLVSQKGIEYGTPMYQTWVLATFHEDPGKFEKRLADLLKINRFIQQKMNLEVTVTEEEIREKFLNQYNNFESEYIRFETQAQAEEFLK